MEGTDRAACEVTPDDVRMRLLAMTDALSLACGDYRYRKIGPHALADSVDSAVHGMNSLMAALPVKWPVDSDEMGPAPASRRDSDRDIYDAFRRLWEQVEILRSSLGPHSRELAGLYTVQGRLLADVEALKGRLTAQDDRITGIATDLQGLEIDVREGRRGDAGGI